MDDKRYKLEDNLTTFQAAMQQLDRFALRAAIQGGISGDSRRQMLSHLSTLESAITNLPEKV